MNKSSKIILVFTIIGFLSSCGVQKKLETCELNYRQAIEANAAKESTISGLKERIKSLEEQLAQSKISKDEYNQQIAKLNQNLADCIANSGKGSANIDKLIGQIQASNDYIKKLTDARFRQDSLNTALSNKLKRSLDNLNDTDVNVQVQKGVVFISLSDKMLYRSGSYDILPSAEAVLDKVAKVINDYKDYDVMVEGHTDNIPFKSGILKDNWDLSALRATAVVRMLQSKFGVAPSRMTAGGRSEFVPKADNLSEGGKSTNRRTEIIILPKLDEFMKLMEIKPKG